ncbi:TOBE domain-containing protein [Oscillatoria sp. FACHB-1407]
MNFIPVQVKAPLLITHPKFRMTLPETWEAKLKPYDGQDVVLGIRPEHLSPSVPAPKNLPVRVDRVEALGSETYLSVSFTNSLAEDGGLQVRTEPDRAVRVGEEIWLAIAPDKIHLFDAKTGVAIA